MGDKKDLVVDIEQTKLKAEKEFCAGDLQVIIMMVIIAIVT